MEKSKVIFGNVMPQSVYKKAQKSKRKYSKKFGDDKDVSYPVMIEKNSHIGDELGVMDLRLTQEGENQNDAEFSRLSGKSRLFNKLVWEPMNYEGFRKLSYNAADQKNAELMAPVYRNIPKDIPVVATHVWPAQAAIHAGMKHVVNAIPDNWPMALLTDHRRGGRTERNFCRDYQISVTGD